MAEEDCLLVKLRVADTAALGKLLREQVQAIRGVRSTRTVIVLETTKESTHLPLQRALISSPSDAGHRDRAAAAIETSPMVKS